ncbi:hypothetical protein M407DRAFT_243461 [Tulasnella calospora MUT 4182]|uniref:Uncharacterized protein n=1 Tax=Tulasnella calospora MUT 4182 TaxID=1051891 RepID=A0A0C3QA89_9AGAM|nr:hypothetical protein M407DRAFT_243461 [Tulasnella calospora MUT 4182]
MLPIHQASLRYQSRWVSNTVSLVRWEFLEKLDGRPSRRGEEIDNVPHGNARRPTHTDHRPAQPRTLFAKHTDNSKLNPPCRQLNRDSPARWGFVCIGRKEGFTAPNKKPVSPRRLPRRTELECGRWVHGTTFTTHSTCQATLAVRIAGYFLI